MEKKRKIGLSTILLIIAIVIIAIMAYFMYKLYEEKNITDIQNSNVDDSVLQDENADSRFVKYVENFKKAREKVSTEYEVNQVSYYKTDYVDTLALRASLDFNGDLYVYPDGDILDDGQIDAMEFKKKFNAKYGEKYKVATNVLDMIALYGGDGGTCYVCYISEDGTMSCITISISDPFISVEKIKETKNLIHFDSTTGQAEDGSLKPLAVNIDGNIR